VLSCIQNGSIHPSQFITHHIPFAEVKDQFKTVTTDGSLIKALIEFA
jgi:Zn-dependent alcohol dehydrogenase